MTSMLPIHHYYGKLIIISSFIILYSLTKCHATNIENDSIINRQLSASISASAWPTTPSSPLCEAYAYLDSSTSINNQDRGFYKTWKEQYLTTLATDVLVDNLFELSSYDDGLQFALQSAEKSSPMEKGHYNTTLDSKLLPFSLSTRAHSPQCEMYRSLALQAITRLNDGVENKTIYNAFIVVEGTHDIYTSIDDMIVSHPTISSPSTMSKSSPSSQPALGSFFGFSKTKSSNNANNDNKKENDDAFANILPNEDIFQQSNINESNVPVMILYGQFHSKEFASFLQYLQQEKHPYVVRYMGDTQFDITNGNNIDNNDKKTTLQGYGVRVDIRNLEYKSFNEKEIIKDSNIDDRKLDDKNQNSKEASINETLNIDVVKEQWLKGIDPELLALHSSSPELKTFIQQHIPHLEGNLETFHRPVIPPKSELKDLSLAATQVISESVDPLWTLIQLSQNLPSHAYALSNVTIPSSLRKITKTKLSKIPVVRRSEDAGLFQFYVNGRRISVERPSFNVFSLLNVLREENAFMENFQNTMKDYLESKEAMDVALSLVTMGKEGIDSQNDDKAEQFNDVMRIDVGRGYKGAILYLNDIEKDAEYVHWPADVESVIMSVQFGRPPTIRKNMITFLIVIDPFDSHMHQYYLSTLQLVFQLMQGMYPVRFGVLFTTNDDIHECQQVLTADGIDENKYCLEKKRNGSDESIENQIASAHAVFTLVQHVKDNYGGMVAANYIYGLLQTLMKENLTEVKMNNLVKFHNQSLARMQLRVDKDDLLSELRNMESNKSVSYEKAVRFAITKNIKPGMAFFNGIPFSINEPSKAESIIQDEINRLLGLIMQGSITNSRKSVYAQLLTGPKVYKRMHSLLNEAKPSYKLFTSFFDSKSLVILSAQGNKSSPMAILEAVVDFTCDAGLSFTESFLRSIHQRSDISDRNDVLLSFRVLPHNGNSAETLLGKVFQHARQFGLINLIKIVEIARKTENNANHNEREEFLSHFQNPVRQQLETLLNQDFECPVLPWNNETFVGLNGRLFKADRISVDDIETLIDLEYKHTKVITEKLYPYMLDETAAFTAVARLASFIGSTDEAETSQVVRSNALAPFQDFIQDTSSTNDKDSFYYDLRNNDDFDGDTLKVTITAILDPLSEATQRAAPLLRTLRDDFKLPIQLLLVPRHEISNDSSLSISSYYRFVADSLTSIQSSSFPSAYFQGLPSDQTLTIRMDVPESWDIQQGMVIQDTDNLRCDEHSCGDKAYHDQQNDDIDQTDINDFLTRVEYNLKHLLFFGQCYSVTNQTPPNGLQFTLTEAFSTQPKPSSGTLVMKTVGYWQLQSNPGAWKLQIAENTRGKEIYELVDGDITNDGTFDVRDSPSFFEKFLVMKDFVNPMEVVLVKRRKGYEDAELLTKDDEVVQSNDDDMIHVFSLATGHLYERFLKIMILSVTKRASKKVKFWLLENFLSPSFKTSVSAIAEKIGCEIQFITYKWPEWLRSQSEKQRIIWGYKILFLDVLFPLDLKKVIYVDADQVVRGDLKELMDLDLNGAPYGYTPMCESREETKGYQFWRSGFWPSHLRGKPYHISALYVVDLQRFRRELVGDQLRAVYQQLTADPNNLSNLDQDLPNYTQHQIKIFSLPQDWLWCESWCSDESKRTSKTIDLCNNPGHKEAKLSMAKRVISGDLFEESWVELDEEIAKYEQEM